MTFSCEKLISPTSLTLLRKHYFFIPSIDTSWTFFSVKLIQLISYNVYQEICSIITSTQNINNLAKSFRVWNGERKKRYQRSPIVSSCYVWMHWAEYAGAALQRTLTLEEYVFGFEIGYTWRRSMALTAKICSLRILYGRTQGKEREPGSRGRMRPWWRRGGLGGGGIRREPPHEEYSLESPYFPLSYGYVCWCVGVCVRVYVVLCFFLFH